MTEDFAVEVTTEGVPLTRENVEGLSIKIVEGLCAADLTHLDRSRKRNWYINNVLTPLIAAGTISDGSKPETHDDRKLRLSHTSISGASLEIGFGATHYLAFKEDGQRSPDENTRLQELGTTRFNDQYALFSRAPGVAGIPISSDGHAFLGERAGSVDDAGLLNGVAGHMNYREDLDTVSLEEDLLREAREELGIQEHEIGEIRFVGGYLHPNRGDMDFAFLLLTSLPDTYFESGAWMERVAEREHKSLVQIPTHAEVQRILGEGRLTGYGKKAELMYSTLGALRSIKPDELAA